MENISSSMSPTIGAIAAALAKAQAVIKPALKDKVNSFLKSNYADLSSVWECIRTPLSSNELSLIQTTSTANGSLMLVTILAHSSGEWIRSEYPINPTKNDPQGIGSAMTYARRYSLCALVGVCSEDDDDASTASKPPKNTTVNPVPKQQKKELSSYKYIYNIPEEIAGRNMEQLRDQLTKRGFQRDSLTGYWYGDLNIGNLSEYLQNGKSNQPQLENIVFTDSDLGLNA